MKVYIKKIACYPQLITKEIYDAASFVNCKRPSNSDKSRIQAPERLALTVKDKVLLNIVVCESKKVATLLFLSKAISDHLKN